MNDVDQKRLRFAVGSNPPWLNSLLLGAGAAVLVFLSTLVAYVFALIPMAIVTGSLLGIRCAHVEGRSGTAQLWLCIVGATGTSLLIPFITTLLSGTLTSAPYEWEMFPFAAVIEFLGYAVPAFIAFHIARSAPRYPTDL